MNDEMIKQYILDVIELAQETKAEPIGDFRNGKLLAYNEVLTMLKTDLTAIDPDHDQYGLAFDLDKVLA